MRFDDQNNGVDLRMLSLLHAMRDRVGFIQEARKLQESQPIDDATWQHICDMGRELDFLLKDDDGPGREDNVIRDFNRRQQDRRTQARCSDTDRRDQDRRTADVVWLGPERRENQRRQYTRRQPNRVEVY